MKLSLIKIGIFSLFLIYANSVCVAQDTLYYSDFHLEAAAASGASHYTIILPATYVNVDTINYQTYILPSSSPCTFGFMNSLEFKEIMPTSSSGLKASNFKAVSQIVVAASYFISDSSGVYDNGYDYSFDMPCNLSSVFYIQDRTEYSNPSLLVSYPICKNAEFSDSAYFVNIKNDGGCIDPNVLTTTTYSTSRSSVNGKVLNTGGLITPCATYDSVFFIRRKVITEEQKFIHTFGPDSLFNLIDTTYTELYRIIAFNTIGVLKDHPYILFSEITGSRTRYFPDTSSTSFFYSTFYFRDVSNSIETLTIDRKSKIFPNPATDIFSVTTFKPFRRIELVNNLGQVVQSADYQYNVTESNVNISGLQRGIYLVKIIFEGSFECKRVIKF